MGTIPQVAAALQWVLTVVADEAARQTGFVVRRRQVSGASFVQALVFGWLAKAEASLNELTQTAGLLGLRISPQGLEQRFTVAAAACVRQVLEAAIGTLIEHPGTAMPELLARFPAVSVQDSTHLPLPEAWATAWPASGQRPGAPPKAGLKVQVQLELGRGQLGLVLQAGREPDRTSPQQQTPLPPGSLRLHDLGYFSLAVLARYAAQGVWTLCRFLVNTALFDPAGQRVDLTILLRQQPGPTLALPVQLGSTHHVAGRLLGVRVPQEVADQRRRRLHADARRRGEAVSAARLAVADWTLYFTTAPPERLSLEEALVLARVRWQVELLFKLWKRHGRLDESRSQQPARQLTEVYAKLLVQLVRHWACLAGGWLPPSHSLVKAAHLFEQAAWYLAASLHELSALLTALTRLGAAGATTTHLDHRRRHPSTLQLLRQPAANPALGSLS